MINQIAQFFKHPLVGLCIQVLSAPIGLVHELAHYIPAQFFGLRPKLRWDSIEHDPAPLPQLIIVTLMPSLLAVFLVFGGAILYLRTPLASVIVYIGIGVFFASVIDWRDAFYMLRQWKREK